MSEGTRRHFTVPLVTLIKNRDWVAVITQAKTPYGKRELRRRDMFGCLPLHVACCEKAPVEVFETFFNEYPESAKEFGRYGTLPLHIVSYMKGSLDVIRSIMKAYPEGVHTRSRSGRYPIHYACFRHGDAEVIKELAGAFPASVREPDEFGYLPIHREMSRTPRPRLDVVRSLLDAYPATAHIPDKSGTSWTNFISKTLAAQDEQGE